MVVWRCPSKNKCQWKRNQIHRNFLTWGRDRIGLKNNRLSGTCRKILNELYISASKCLKREEWDTQKKEENKDSPMVVNLVKKNQFTGSRNLWSPSRRNTNKQNLLYRHINVKLLKNLEKIMLKTFSDKWKLKESVTKKVLKDTLQPKGKWYQIRPCF